MRTDLVLEFADGEYPFKLSVIGVLELQEKCLSGFGALFSRVMAGTYSKDEKIFGFPLEAQFHLADLLETIRLGLIGGGMEPVNAKRLVERYAYPAQPMKGTWELASAILFASMEGYEVKSPDMEEPDSSKKKTKPIRKEGSTRARRSRTSPQ
jgi:hypothetical protein